MTKIVKYPFYIPGVAYWAVTHFGGDLDKAVVISKQAGQLYGNRYQMDLTPKQATAMRHRIDKVLVEARKNKTMDNRFDVYLLATQVKELTKRLVAIESNA